MKEEEKTYRNEIVNIGYKRGKLVVTILEYTFECNGHKGAVGHYLEVIDKETFDKETSYDSILERIKNGELLIEPYYVEEEDYIENLEYQKLLDEEKKDMDTFSKKWCDEICNKGEQVECTYDGEYNDELPMIKDKLGLTDETAYYTNKVSWGRVFDGKYQGNCNKRVSALIRSYEKENDGKHRMAFGMNCFEK